VRTRLIILILLLLFGALSAHAKKTLRIESDPTAQDASKPRKFQTTYKIDMYAEPGINAKKIGSVPSGVIFEALEETERYGGSIKVINTVGANTSINRINQLLLSSLTGLPSISIDDMRC